MLKWVILLCSVGCSAAAHVALKKGATALTLSDPFTSILRTALGSWPLWIGVALHGVALVTWIVALNKIPLSVAYPFIAAGYLIVAFVSWVFLNEPYSHSQAIGVILVVVGILLIVNKQVA